MLNPHSSLRGDTRPNTLISKLDAFSDFRLLLLPVAMIVLEGLVVFDLDTSKAPLKEFEELRNRITHPKQRSDLAISDEENQNG